MLWRVKRKKKRYWTKWKRPRGDHSRQWRQNDVSTWQFSCGDTGYVKLGGFDVAFLEELVGVASAFI